MSTGDFRVADISLADFGRKEIEIAEHEVKKWCNFLECIVIEKNLMTVMKHKRGVDSLG